MDYRRKMRELLNYDYIIVALSIVVLFIYTSLFVVINNVLRYGFLLACIYTLYSLYQSTSDILDYYKAKRIKKYNNTRVNLKLFNNRRRKVKKAF